MRNRPGFCLIPYPRGIKEVLQFQLNGSFNGMKQFVSETSDEEWASRPYAGANLIGFTAWHTARSIDWALNCILRDRPEVADGDEWKDLRVDGAFFGAGASRETADNVARSVPRQRVIDYLSAMQQDTLQWLESTPQEWLEEPADLKSRRAQGYGYCESPVWDEIYDLDGIPRWQLIARPCISHIRVHYGELTSQLESLRAK